MEMISCNRRCFARKSNYVSWRIVVAMMVLVMTVPFFVPNAANAQTTTSRNDAIHEQYEPYVGQLLSFLAKIYNALGNDTYSQKEKNTIIQSSYQKVFLSDKVQIEDDLVIGRKALVVKNVQSYLQDIDIFYKTANFKFKILEIKAVTNLSNQSFLRVAVNQQFNGINVKGKAINYERVRFMEIAINDQTDDLKISSIYTTLVNEEQSLKKWWESLSFEWKVIFQRAVKSVAQPDNDRLKEMISLETLDISYNKYINEIEPLAMVSNLREIDISNTNVADLSPLRNNKRLESLNISNTKINNVGALKFTPNLKYLFLENTNVKNLKPLFGLRRLEKVICTGTGITEDQAKALADATANKCEVVNEVNASLQWWHQLPLVWREKFMLDFSFQDQSPDDSKLGKIESLEKLTLHQNKNILSLKPIAKLQNLKELDCSGTGIQNLQGIENLSELRFLNFSDTEVKDLSQIIRLKNLKQIQFDNTNIPEVELAILKKERPDIKIMNRFTALVSWWIRVPEAWQNTFLASINYQGQKPIPPEVLYDIVNIKTLDISNREDIESLEPLFMLTNLRSLDISNTMMIDNLDPIDSLYYLERLICSGNPIHDLMPLAGLTRLKVLDVKNTPVASIDPLNNLKQLEELDISATKVNNLKGLRALINMKKLKCYNTNISSINPLITLTKLKSLLCYNTKLSKKKVDEFKKIRSDCHVIFY